MPVVYDAKLTPLGYQQITSLVAAAALTVPAHASLAIIQATGQSVRWRDDAVDPTATVGMTLAVGESLRYTGNLAALKVIQTAATAVLNVSYYAGPINQD